MYGLLILDLIDNDWTFFNDANGGLADYVKDIVFYDNNLYMGTDKGIYTFSTIINNNSHKSQFRIKDLYIKTII